MVGHATVVGCASTEELKASGFTVLRSSDGGLEDVERRPWLRGGDETVVTRAWRSDVVGCASTKELW